MNPFHDHTIIHIDIQAPNKLEILTCVRETFDYMPGWLLCSSVHASLTDARFYCFNLTMHTFEWWRANDSYADTMDEDDVVIKDLADISHLLEFVWLNGDSLRLPHTTSVVVDPPKKRKKEPDGPNLSQMKKKLSELGNEYYKSSSPDKIKSMLEEMVLKDLDSTPKQSFNPMEFIKHMQPMDMPMGNVFYKDLTYPYYGGISKPYEASPKVKLSHYPYWGYENSAVTKKAKEYAHYAKQAQEEAYKKWQWGWDKIPNSSPYDEPIKAGYDY